MKNYLHNSLRSLFLSLAVLLAMPMLAEKVEIDGIWYNLESEGKQAEVIYKRGGKYSGEVVIPESVEHEGTTYSVTSIGESAFEDCSGLTSVTIPNSVKSIGGEAFEGCSNLEKIELNCKNIGNWFSGIKSIKEIIIGNSVTSIGRYAFGDCPELLDVYCHAESVPSTDATVFNSSNYKNATLHVPAASIENYKSTKPWKSFGNIVALTEEETGIEEVKGENEKVKTAVYDLSGRRVLKAQKGIYIQNGRVVVK